MGVSGIIGIVVAIMLLVAYLGPPIFFVVSGFKAGKPWLGAVVAAFGVVLPPLVTWLWIEEQRHMGALAAPLPFLLVVGACAAGVFVASWMTRRDLRSFIPPALALMALGVYAILFPW